MGYAFNPIVEKASAEDLFDDHAHDRSASAIFELTSSNMPAMTIGLEGGWGSGKSTVINLYREKLRKSEDDSTLLILFDAWAHEGDPLRRCFLEALIDSSDKFSSSLREMKETVSGRHKTTKVTIRKSPSRLGRKLSVATLLMPLGLGFLSLVDSVGVHESVLDVILNRFFWIGFLLSLSPFYVLLWWKRYGDRDEAGNPDFSVLESNSTEDHVQEMVEDRESTSIEFERYFSSIMRTFLGPDGYRKVVVVIDNLDRVSPEQALTIWGTLQTFFQHRSGASSEEWTDRLWFIIPYDRQAMGAIWADDGEAQDDRRSSFLNKCIQLVVEVPEPVMSSWASYLRKAASRSLTDWPQEEIRDVCNSYQNVASALDKSPRPRDIHTFLNRVGVLGLTWGGLVSASALAIYAAMRVEADNRSVRSSLLDPESSTYQRILGSEGLLEELAGLLFGVPKEKGMQLLLGPEILATLSNGDAGGLRGLEERHGHGFWVVWQAISDKLLIQDSSADGYVVSYTHALHGGLINKWDALDQQISQLKQLWQTKSKLWDFEKHDVMSTLPLIYEMAGRDDQILYLSSAVFDHQLAKEVAKASGDGPSEFVLKQLKALSDFLLGSGAKVHTKQFSSLGVDQWKSWVTCADPVGLYFVAPPPETLEAIATQACESPGSIDNSKLNSLSVARRTNPKSKAWEAVASSFVGLAKNESREIGNDRLYGFLLELTISSTAPAARLITSLLKSKEFWATTSKESVENAPSLAILTALTFREEIQTSELPGNQVKEYWAESHGLEFSRSLARGLAGLGVSHVVWDLLKDGKNKLAMELASIFLEDGDSHFFNSPDSLRSASSLMVAEDFLESLVLSLCAHTEVSESVSLMAEDIVNHDEDLYVLLKHGSESCRLIVKSALAKAQPNEWESLIANDSPILELLGKEISLDHRFKQAFVSVISSRIRGEISEIASFEKIYGLLDVCQDSTEVEKEFAKLFFDCEDAHLDDMEFKMISGLARKNLAEISPKLIERKLVSALKGKDHLRLEWFASLDYEHDTDVIEEVRTRLADLHAEEAASKDYVRTIAEKFGVQLVREIDNHGAPSDSDSTEI